MFPGAEMHERKKKKNRKRKRTERNVTCRWPPHQTVAKREERIVFPDERLPKSSSLKKRHNNSVFCFPGNFEEKAAISRVGAQDTDGSLFLDLSRSRNECCFFSFLASSQRCKNTTRGEVVFPKFAIIIAGSQSGGNHFL